jgi:hypothetical protein
MRKATSVILRFCRSRLVAYILISFAISGSFFMVSHSFDRKLAKVQLHECQRQNQVITAVGMKPIDCSKVTIR